MFEEYNNANQAAKKLGIHPETYKRLCRSGVIGAEKFQNNWLIHASHLKVLSHSYNPKRGRRPKN